MRNEVSESAVVSHMFEAEAAPASKFCIDY